jgi:hypothetical protein
MTYTVPTFIGSAVGGGTPTCTNNVPAGTQENDLLLWFITVAYGTRTDPTDWELLDQTGSGALWMRLAPASPPASYSVTVPAAACRSVMHAYRGVDLSDPILAFRTHTGATSNKKTDPLYFQQCSYMLASFNGQVANLSPTKPAGWTQAGLQAGSGGGDRGVGGAYVSVSDTEGAVASGDWGGNTNPYIATVALRADGQETLSLKARGLSAVLSTNAPMVPNNSATSSSQAVSLGMARRTGDLDVLIYSCKHTANGTPPSFSISGTGWVKKGTDQIYTVSGVAPFQHLGIGVASRIISDGSGGTVTTAATVASLSAYGIVFSTGSTGPDPLLPGTMGQSNDGSNDLTQTIPGMTLEDYAENNILITALCTDRGDTFITPPAGFDALGRWASGVAGNQGTIWATKMNSGADPASVNASTNTNQRNVAVQFAVGVVLEGVASPDVTGARVVWIG